MRRLYATLGLALFVCSVHPAPANAATLYLTVRNTGTPATADRIIKLDTTTNVETLVIQNLGSEYDSLILDLTGRIIYDVENVAQLRRVNANGTGDAFITGTGQTPKDLALQPGGGSVLVAELNQQDIAKVDLTTNVRTIFGSYTGGFPEGIAYNPITGQLFANLGNVAFGVTPLCANAGEERVYRLDTTTGAPLASSGCIQGGLDGLEYDPFTGQLYATTFTGGHIFSFDPTTLASVDRGDPLGDSLDGIVSDANGILYYISRNDANPNLNSVNKFNPVTNASSLQKVIGGLDDVAVLVVPPPPPGVPEPATLMLVGSGLLAVARRRWPNKK